MLRELRTEDADAVAALYAEAFGSDRDVDAEEVRGWIRNTELRPEWLRVLEVEGRVVGYADIWPTPEDVAIDIAAPGHWETFVGWAEEHARAEGIPRVRVFVPAGHEPAGLLADRGYVVWRSSLTMEIDLDGPPASGRLPPGIALRSYDPADEGALRATLNEAFAEDAFWQTIDEANFREFYLGARGHDPSLWLLAWQGETLVGAVLARTQHGSDTTLGWIGTLAVSPSHRGRGLGEALLRAGFRALYDRGLRRVGLGVDSQNVTGAVRLYERVGMHAAGQDDHWVRDL